MTFLTIDQRDKLRQKERQKEKQKERQKERKKERRSEDEDEDIRSDLVTQLTFPHLSSNGLVQDSIYGLNFFKDCRFKTNSRTILSEML